MVLRRALMPISISTLLAGSRLGFEVFVRSANGLPSTKLFEANEEVSRTRLQEYASAGVTCGFVYADESHKYQAYLRENWHLLLADDQMQIDARLEIMSDVVRGLVERQFQGGDIQGLIRASNQIAETTVQLISSHDIALSQICSVIHHDYGTFTHSANVSFFAVMLAKELGFDEHQQHEIAVGGLLHDIGKLAIDSKIINKPGPLNLREMSMMKKHPVIGLERLASHAEVTLGQLMMTYQHHERVNGTGYPCGVPGNQIHPYARLCAIVDVFEALTSQRPYRKPMEISEAIEFMLIRRDVEFDPEMLDTWERLTRQEELCHV